MLRLLRRRYVAVRGDYEIGKYWFRINAERTAKWYNHDILTVMFDLEQVRIIKLF